MCRRAAEEEKKEEAGDIVKPIPGLVIPVKVDPKLGGPSVQVQMVYSYVFHESFYLYVQCSVNFSVRLDYFGLQSLKLFESMLRHV